MCIFCNFYVYCYFQVGVLSQDDKSRVPIGITAAKVQAPALMHLNYRVKLADHDWVVAAGHKLIPSVYGAMAIKPDGMGKEEAVTYSGPTYIAIRSGRHDSSTAASHALDFHRLLDLEEFRPFLKTEDGQVKPVVIISVDGGPDENPRYSKVIAQNVQHFKDFDLDGLFVVTNAPGRSAYNRVERRMAPLSRQLSMVVLPHDQFGNHLDKDGKTVDEALERENFRHAGEVLGELWSELKIDGHDVVAEYITPDQRLPQPAEISPEWYVDHVREGQYILQVSLRLFLVCKD